MPDIIKPKRATRSVADKSEKILEKDELLVITPDKGSGTGRYGLKFGDGATPAKDLPYAVDGENADEMTVQEFTEESDENPVLSPGDKIKTLCGKLLKKFTYLETLLGKKVSTSDIYNGLDSTSTSLVASANTVRQVNEKTDKNASDITQLNSNISDLISAQDNKVDKIQLSGNGTTIHTLCLYKNANDGKLYLQVNWNDGIAYIQADQTSTK